MGSSKLLLVWYFVNAVSSYLIDRKLGVVVLLNIGRLTDFIVHALYYHFFWKTLNSLHCRLSMNCRSPQMTLFDNSFPINENIKNGFPFKRVGLATRMVLHEPVPNQKQKQNKTKLNPWTDVVLFQNRTSTNWHTYHELLLMKHVIFFRCRIWRFHHQWLETGATESLVHSQATASSATADVVATVPWVATTACSGARETDVWACEGKRMCLKASLVSGWFLSLNVLVI